MKILNDLLINYKFIKLYRLLTTLKFYKSALRTYLVRDYKIGKFEKAGIENIVTEKRILEEAQEREVCIPEYIGVSEQKIKKFCTGKVYCGVIEEATIVGATSCIFQGKKCLNDIFVEQDERLDVSYGPIMFDYGDSVVARFHETDKTIDYAIDLVGSAPENYYHVTVELLSRLNYVQNQEEYKNWPLIVDEAIFEIPQLKQVLEKINDTGRKVISIKDGECCLVKRLLYISRSCWMPMNVKDRETTKEADFAISELHLRSIREKMLAEIETAPKLERKVFISRRNSVNPRLVNEPEVKEFFAKNGFEIAYPEEMTFEEQVKFFSEVRCMVAATGAAMTNVLYCPEGAVIGCIVPSEFRFYLYSTMAYLLNQKPIFLSADITKKTLWPAMDRFVLEIKYCEKFINKIASGEKDEIY